MSQEALALASLSKKSLTLPGMQSDWEIDPDELEICRRPDGTEWELGSGASARVSRPPDVPLCFSLDMISGCQCLYACPFLELVISLVIIWRAWHLDCVHRDAHDMVNSSTLC